MSLTAKQLEGVTETANAALPEIARHLGALFRLAMSSPIHGAILYAILAGLADDIRNMTLGASDIDDGELEQIEKSLRQRGMVRVEMIRAATDEKLN